MTVQDQEFSDEDLTAYLDGEINAGRARDIESALDRDPLLRERLDALDVPVNLLKVAADPQHIGAPEFPLQHIASRRRANGWVLLAAGIGAGFLVGIGGSLLASHYTAPHWIDVVASYQSLYVPETIAAARQSEADLEVALSAIEQDFDLDLSRIREADGLELRRVQRLGFEGNQLMQIAFRSPTGEAIALCIMRSGEDDYGIRSGNLEGMAASHWAADGTGFLLIGGDNTALIERSAEHFRSVF